MFSEGTSGAASEGAMGQCQGRHPSLFKQSRRRPSKSRVTTLVSQSVEYRASSTKEMAAKQVKNHHIGQPVSQAMAAEAKSKPRVTLAERAIERPSCCQKEQAESAQKIVKHAVKGTAEESQSPNCSSIGFPQSHEAAPPSS
ncbi:MAG: hypothetical protein Q9202_003433 [Teloschistes flavicans]